MKKCSEFENNTIGHMALVGQPTCQPGIPYMYDYHYLCVFNIIFTK